MRQAYGFRNNPLLSHIHAITNEIQNVFDKLADRSNYDPFNLLLPTFYCPLL